MAKGQSREIKAVLKAAEGGGDLAGAIRALWTPLKGDDLFGMRPALWQGLVAAADAARGARWEPDPQAERVGPAARDLGEGWYQCPHCDDAFEGRGAEAACPSCGGALAAALPCLHLDLGDAGQLWWEPGAGARSRISDRLESLGALVGRMRVQGPAGAFTLFDASGRAAAADALPLGTIPHGAAVLGREGDTLWLGHPARLSLWRLPPGGALEEAPMEGSWAPDFLAARIAACLFGDRGAPASGSEAAAADEALAGITAAHLWDRFPPTLEEDGYLECEALEALLRVEGVSVERLSAVAEAIMDTASFFPGGDWIPDWMDAPAGERIPGSPIVLLGPILGQLHERDRGAFDRLAARLLGYILCDGDVLDHDARAAHAEVGRSLAQDLAAAELASLPEASHAHLAQSYRVACEAAAGNPYGADLLGLGIAMAAAGPEALREAATEGLEEWVGVHVGEPGGYLPRYLETGLLEGATLGAQRDALASADLPELAGVLGCLEAALEDA